MKIFWSRWIQGRHRATEFASAHEALRAAIEAEKQGICGRSQVVGGESHENISVVLMDAHEVSAAGHAFGGAHPPAWRDRDTDCARKWQKICDSLKQLGV